MRPGPAQPLELDKKYQQTITGEDWENLPNPVLDSLIRAEAIVPASEKELESLLFQNKENIRDADKRFLSYTIQPTANCQLGCHYCGQEHTKLVF